MRQAGQRRLFSGNSPAAFSYFVSFRSLSSQLQFSLAEKDAVIEEMRREGEKLAQEEYKKNSVIKKLKAKEKELQTSLDKTK